MKDKNWKCLSAFVTQYSENNTVDVLIDFRDYKLTKRSISPWTKSLLCRLSVIPISSAAYMNVDLVLWMFSSRQPGIGCWQWRKPGAEFGGTEKIFADRDEFFFWKHFQFCGKNFWWPFFSHRPGFSNFPFLFLYFPDLYFVRHRTQPFPHKKNTFLLFSYFPAHPTTLLLKILGGTNAWAVPPPQTWGDRPSSPPLGFRPWLLMKNLDGILFVYLNGMPLNCWDPKP